MTGKRLIGKRKNIINICYLIDISPSLFIGGGQIHLKNLIRQLKLRITNYELRIFAGLSSHLFFRLFWMVYVIPQVIFYHFFRQKFSLIHAHSIPAMAAGKIISILLKIPIVVTVHGSNMMDIDKFKVKNSKLKVDECKLFIERLALTKIKYDVQITVARDFLEYPNINKNVIYIPNGVDVEKYGPQHYASQSRGLRPRVMASQVRGSGVPTDFSYEKSGLVRKSSKLKVVLFVGRKSDPVKGFAILEEAMEVVKKRIPDVKLLVMDGSCSQNEVIEAYHRADLFVLSSLSEGFPLTLLEAWAAKLPVIATRVGEIPYLVEGSHPSMAEYLVEPGNSMELANAIVGILKSKNLVKLGARGYLLAKKYNWETVAEKTLKVYNSVLHENF